MFILFCLFIFFFVQRAKSTNLGSVVKYYRLGNRGDMIMIECKQTIEMMKDNVIGPFEFKKVCDWSI